MECIKCKRITDDYYQCKNNTYECTDEESCNKIVNDIKNKVKITIIENFKLEYGFDMTELIRKTPVCRCMEKHYYHPSLPGTFSTVDQYTFRYSLGNGHT